MASHFHFHFQTLTLTILSILLLTTTTTTISISLSEKSTPTFYSILESNGLPKGLFPKGITDFSINSTTGHFHVLSPSPCDAQFETRVRYDWNITGTVSYGRIANLSGVAAQELFLWLPVNGIRVDLPSSGLIYFDVGIVFKQFSLAFFETPKDCTNDVLMGKNEAEKLVREPVMDEHRAIS